MVDDTGASPVLYYIHTDALGSPQKLTDGSKALVWDGAFDPFGNPASLTGSVTMNLRFPGQTFDAETGLNQNWNRDYDPSIGRYTESDPIGLDGGINTYSYVLSNPLRYRDNDGTGVQGAILGGLIFGVAGAETGPFDAAIALEGARIGSTLEDLIDAIASAREQPERCWPKQCEIQYDRDHAICGRLKTNGARGRCRASAGRRQAHCIQTNGESDGLRCEHAKNEKNYGAK
jgi:RHS repeat-associated protein